MMHEVKLTPEQVTRLNGSKELVPLTDDAGKTIGHFMSEEAYVALLYEIELNRPIDPADRERAREEFRREGGYSTAEAIVRIEQMARDWKGAQ